MPAQLAQGVVGNTAFGHKNLLFEYRCAGGDDERLPELAKDLVLRQPWAPQIARARTSVVARNNRPDSG